MRKFNWSNVYRALLPHIELGRGFYVEGSYNSLNRVAKELKIQIVTMKFNKGVYCWRVEKPR